MIISKTPYRISFFGGGTDFPEWFEINTGAVISATIDKYCYLSCRVLPPFFPHKHRFVYSIIEDVVSLDEIKHPCLREVFSCMNIQEGLEIHHDGDLPARSGLGSSSAFTVGLLNVLNAQNHQMSSKEELAKKAIYVERDLIGETVGIQDQIAVAYGGLNHITFNKNGTFEVSPVIISKGRSNEFNDTLMLFYTGVQRTASSIEKEKLKRLKDNQKLYHSMFQLVDEALKVLLANQFAVGEFGALMHEGWKLKKALSSDVSNSMVDEAYHHAIKHGALAGKILGAGGGGFLLLVVPPERQQAVKTSLSKLVHVPFKFEYDGSKIALYQPKGL